MTILQHREIIIYSSAPAAAARIDRPTASIHLREIIIALLRQSTTPFCYLTQLRASE